MAAKKNTEDIKECLRHLVFDSVEVESSLANMENNSVMNEKCLFEDFLKEHFKESFSEKSQLGLPHCLCLKNKYERNSVQEKDSLINGLLRKKLLSSNSSCNDILQMINFKIRKRSGRTISLHNGLYRLKAVSVTLSTIQPFLKLMAVAYKMVMLSTKEPTDKISTRKINLELKHFLIICKTKFTLLKDVSKKDASEYYDYLVALCGLYVKSAAMITSTLSKGYRINSFIYYVLSNSFERYIHVLLQIDQRYLKNVNILLPFIRKIFEYNENFSCKMYLFYILAVRHINIKVILKSLRKKIKKLNRKCLNLSQPASFYEWLTTHFPECEEHVDIDDDIPKFLMTCPESIHDTFIIKKDESERRICLEIS